MIYDAVIMCHQKDYNKLPFCFDSLNYLDPKPDNIYIVSPDGISYDNSISIKDSEAISISAEEITYERPNWIFQQLVKLYQNFTKNKVYMCIDADVIFNRQIKFLNKTFFLSDRQQHHEPYFNFMKAYFGINDFSDSTFINDFMIFDKEICSDMMPNINNFVTHLNSYLKDKSYLFSEFETYGNYVLKRHPELYSIKKTKTKMFGKYDEWQRNEILAVMGMCENKDFDLITIHTWT